MMAGTLLNVLLFAGLALSGPLEAQQTKIADPPAQSVPAPYLLAAEDVLSVTVINFPNLSSPQLVVPPDGKITLPLLEPVAVTGMTTTDVARTLTEKWRRYVVNPSVTVLLVQRRKESVLIYGSVVRAGVVEYRRTLKAVEVLAFSGGGTPTADLTKVVLTHTNGDKQTLDLSHPEKQGAENAILMQPDDTVYVPERIEMQVSVLGEVMRPGSLDYKENMTVLDALTATGGVKESADLAGTTLLHAGSESKLNLDALLRHGDITVNVKLAGGDRIMIPENRSRTYVFGAVLAPGYYSFRPGDHVLDAIKGSGGPSREADLARINVIHIDPTKTKAAVQQVNIQTYLNKGDTKGNIALEPGDVVFIFDKRHKIGLVDVVSALSGLNLLSNTAHILAP